MSVSETKVRITVVIDITVDWGIRRLALLLVGFVLAITSFNTLAGELIMNVFKHIAKIGAALMPVWYCANDEW